MGVAQHLCAIILEYKMTHPPPRYPLPGGGDNLFISIINPGPGDHAYGQPPSQPVIDISNIKAATIDQNRLEPDSQDSALNIIKLVFPLWRPAFPRVRSLSDRVIFDRPMHMP